MLRRSLYVLRSCHRAHTALSARARDSSAQFAASRSYCSPVADEVPEKVHTQGGNDGIDAVLDDICAAAADTPIVKFQSGYLGTVVDFHVLRKVSKPCERENLFF